MEINKDKTIKALKILLAICLAIPALYFVWLLKRVFVSDNFIIPSDSMFPTLMPGDNVLVDKTLYGARIYTDLNFSEDGVELKSLRTRGRDAVRRNDIVVFNMPYHKREIRFVINYVYCKRCIALPGDSISAVNGHYNNNYTGPQQPLPLPHNRHVSQPWPIFSGCGCGNVCCDGTDEDFEIKGIKKDMWRNIMLRFFYTCYNRKPWRNCGIGSGCRNCVP